MNQPTNQDVRNAVIVAVLITVIVMFALLDPTCRSRPNIPHEGPVKSIAP